LAVYAYSLQRSWDEGTYQENFLATVMQSMERHRFRKETKEASEVKSKKKEDEADQIKYENKIQQKNDGQRKEIDNAAAKKRGEIAKDAKNNQLSKGEMQKFLQTQSKGTKKKEMDKARNATKGKKEA